MTSIFIADDPQLYLSTKPDEIAPLAKLDACLKDVEVWMTTTCLFIYLFIYGPKHGRRP